MTLRLTTGDRVPVDGEITQGEARFDEAMLTGEPVPQQKARGDAIHAGTVVQDGSVLFTASAVGSHTTLSRIIRMVRQAQSSKPEIGQLADKISAIFVPVVVGIALLSAAIWYVFGPAPQIVYTGDCHHGADHCLSLRARSCHANVDHLRRRPCR